MLTEADLSEIDAAMACDAVASITRYSPPNNGERHDDAEDTRLLDNVRRQAPWIRGVIAASVAELQ